VILVLCAFGAELEPLRTRLAVESTIQKTGIRGYYGRIAETHLALVSTGIGMRRAQESTRRALDVVTDATLVVAVGVAGALSDKLRVGEVVLADKLTMRRGDGATASEHVLDVPRDWFDTYASALTSAGLGFTKGAILTSRHPLTTGAEKRAAGEHSGAVAVDMESAAIALEAATRGLPFVCMRTILDTVDQELVGARLADEYGHVRPRAALQALVTNPGIVVGLYRLLRNLRLSTHALANAFEQVARRIDQRNIGDLR
jgi:adenosylhomocysteine nucleosidase